MPEYIAEIDWLDNIIKKRRKDELKTEQFIHRISLVIPRLMDDRILLAKRAAKKEPFPDVWCCAVGGRVSWGESYEQAARREMIEEVGIESDLIPLATSLMNNPQERALYKVFTTLPMKRESFIACEREIASLEAITVQEVNFGITEYPDHFAPAFKLAYARFFPQYLKHLTQPKENTRRF